MPVEVQVQQFIKEHRTAEQDQITGGRCLETPEKIVSR
jgi:hypothetical protein